MKVLRVLSTFAACIIFSYLFGYLLGAFVQWDFNPVNWSLAARMVVSLIPLFPGLILGVGLTEFD